MICVSLQKKSYRDILQILDDPSVEMAEIRLDLCELSDEEIEDLFGNSDTPLIATARNRPQLLEKAIMAGARYADLEIEAPAPVSRHIQKLCSEYGTELIRSFHDFGGTPTLDFLCQVTDRCFRYGADIAKIVTTARSQADAETIESLYAAALASGRPARKGHLTAFAMGEEGRRTRIDALALGAPFSYAALTEEEATAPGQLTAAQMREEIYGQRKPYAAEGLRMPASKSFAQRAIICAALSEGTSELGAYSPCSDSEAALKVAEGLGAKVEKDGSTIRITGIGPIDGPAPMKELHVGESGLLTRMMIPVMSAIGSGDITLTGEKTLLKRPLSGAVNIMASFGVILSNAGEASKEIHVPVRIKGNIIPGTADVSGKGGSQLISGLMMALPLCSKQSMVFVSEPKSIPYMYITQDVLKKFGVRISCEMEGDAQMLEQQDWTGCTGMTFRIPGKQQYKAASFEIEGDWSSAANFLVAGAVFGSAELYGLDTGSVQADISIMDILVDAGAVVSTTEDGAVCVRKAPLEAFTADLNNCPDLFPIVALLSAFCAGASRMAGVGRLASKESDRATAIVDMLTRMGVPARIEEDELIVEGMQLSERLAGGKLLKGGKYTTSHDHRMVMALSVAALGADSEIIMDDRECVAKSFPGFFELWTNS